ncbi:TauD/TfdA family dioxygenase [Aidingimonas halophila]|uniref:Taurine dioxygenase, alpha-ketoglutarate-dependent n=1 Tax=Aidingimonas halophila TaxID=574349 RepID=A0A1H2X1E7_9GAMM|nr:TauD/TfdA family dioxygenase [Aidingimonas halophila]GHC27959.1 hypothetical protein GCM10008094_19550 [Aidingimonas halophila]SDW86637.1 Taurine dioxygenase, alpha-ketoglutarate-dependent [Aidingimonas halophila]
MIKRHDINDYPAIAKTLSHDGAVLVKNISSKSDFLWLCEKIGDIVPHRDSDKFGITSVASKEPLRDKAGFAGFSRDELALHTDRANITLPPNLVALYCVEQAKVGGDTRCVDGRKLLETLYQQAPDIAEWAIKEDQVIYSDLVDSYTGPIYKKQSNGSISLQFRCDGRGYYRHKDLIFVERFLQFAESLEEILKLEPRDALIINNCQWLHGRTKFIGSREMLRVHLRNIEDYEQGFFLNDKTKMSKWALI